MAPPGQDRSGKWSEPDDEKQDRARHGIGVGEARLRLAEPVAGGLGNPSSVPLSIVGEGRAVEHRHGERKDLATRSQKQRRSATERPDGRKTSTARIVWSRSVKSAATVSVAPGFPRGFPPTKRNGWLLAASNFASSPLMAPPAPRIVIISISFRLENRWKDRRLLSAVRDESVNSLRAGLGKRLDQFFRHGSRHDGCSRLPRVSN
jgi:hypothetical protein